MTDTILEPRHYFEEVKASLNIETVSKLRNQLNIIETEYNKAKSIGQSKMIDMLDLHWKASLDEIILIENGFDKFVFLEDLQKFVDKVTPKNSIKIIELERFPRNIPQENIDVIIKAKNLNVFDGYVVVFTDLTENKYQTEDEKKFVARNRDPIVFGYWATDRLTKYKKFYMITDWEDEYCDLTFDKLISKMSLTVEQTTLKENPIEYYKSLYHNMKEIDSTPENFFQRLKGKLSNVFYRK